METTCSFAYLWCEVKHLRQSLGPYPAVLNHHMEVNNTDTYKIKTFAEAAPKA